MCSQTMTLSSLMAFFAIWTGGLAMRKKAGADLAAAVPKRNAASEAAFDLVASGKLCKRTGNNTYTATNGCDGWERTSLAECRTKCENNEAPSNNCQGTCRFVVWDDNPDYAPGWCQLASSCNELVAKPTGVVEAKHEACLDITGDYIDKGAAGSQPYPFSLSQSGCSGEASFGPNSFTVSGDTITMGGETGAISGSPGSYKIVWPWGQTWTQTPEKASGWVQFSSTKGCHFSPGAIILSAGKVAPAGGEFTLETCKTSCEENNKCVGIDFYSETGWCTTFSSMCSSPTTTHDGVSSYTFSRSEAPFDPSSPLTSYQDQGSCGPRGDDAKADTSSCQHGAEVVVNETGDYRYEVVARVDDCNYFQYTIYRCKA